MSATNDSWRRKLSGTIVGTYVLDDFIGAGKIGFVYKAHRVEFPNIAQAVKLTFDLQDGWTTELKKVMALRLVEGVVHFHDLGAAHVGSDARLCQFTVWDYIAPGENLKAYLQRVKKVETSFLLAVVERILLVLHACDAEGVKRHGDLHSGNILIGAQSLGRLDDSLQPRAPIYVSDFGFGATGGIKKPKDDYQGLLHIINEMVECIEYTTATPTHRQILQGMQRELGKLLNERSETERRQPFDLLKVLRDLKREAQAGAPVAMSRRSIVGDVALPESETPSVGQFQVSEMIGERWEWWKQLFVPTVPARSKILALDIPTVVTGPRGCGKTMIFRRLSERLIVECGEVDGLPVYGSFAALYVNANDFADAFARFPERPTERDEARLISYANLCVLGDLLTVQSARAGRLGEAAPEALLSLVQQWLIPDTYKPLIVGEDRLERYRDVLAQIKWAFMAKQTSFPGYSDLSQHRWLPRFLEQVRDCCPWIGERAMLLFIDDFSTPRVSASMQRVLNRLFLQRSPAFLAKVATEASSTFISQDSSGKELQDGDDYQLVDMGEEALFLPDAERLEFLSAVFARRLEVDARVPHGGTSLDALLGKMQQSKTEFARRLRSSEELEDTPLAVPSGSQRRGPSRARVHYHGANVFADLWSGDTRTMIQLISDVIEHSGDKGPQKNGSPVIKAPVDSEIQDRVFRNRGGEWLNSHTRSVPTNLTRVHDGIARIRKRNPEYALVGPYYGDHLKAVVEAFVAAAKRLLHGPTYKIKEGGGVREVPRMAFRIEIVDDFRVDGLAEEIYRDLVRYGLFMRDSRGKSVRGTFVPRLYLRRLLLPYCTLALSKRDSVTLKCSMFVELLLEPDKFKKTFETRRGGTDQLTMFVDESISSDERPEYDDLGLVAARGEAEEKFEGGDDEW